MLIRQELASDVQAVRAVTAAAFERVEHAAPPVEPDGVPGEATLVGWLRDDPGWVPELSLVAESGPAGAVVGHVVATHGRLADRPAPGLGLGTSDRGRRMDTDLHTYREVWGRAPVGGGQNPAVTPTARQIPLLFGAVAPKAFERMARWGQGYIGGSVPPTMVESAFTQARTAWQEAGRDGHPHLVAIAYFALTDPDTGRRKVGDYYAGNGDFTDMVVNGMSDAPERIRETVKAFADIGADELILNPTTDEPDDVQRLADIVL